MLTSVAALIGLLAFADAAHTHGHAHLHRSHNLSDDLLEKRGGQCQFPTGAGLVAVTPGSENAGWAMSPDQPCKPGNWCPYACPPGQVSMQWNPDATSYTYPQSMDGGLYCDENGKIQKPFPNKPYCVDGTGAVNAVNKAGKPLSFCQTVLPGNEAMLIPTLVEGTAALAVPDPSYWCSTAAHYYINPPGTGNEGCIWGTSANPVGNWAYFVAGANTDSSGNTFVKIGYNPVVQEAATPFRNTPATFGVEITCDEGAGCNGLPCKIDPSVNGLNQVTSADSADGAGGAAFCVVTVPKGKTANIVVFEAGSSGSGSSSSSKSSSSSSSSSTSTTPTTTAASTTTSYSSTASTSTSSPTSSTPSSTTSSTSSSSDSSTDGSSTPSSTPKSTSASYSYAPHVFAETAASGDSSAAATHASGSTASPSASPSSAASPMSTGSMTGLALCLMAGIMMQY
ncbi:hypothetical protein EYB25_003675 [Talaromyces marneffei]|nr:hypothetical protein EYB25_003675 [Talaromyces marneffei]